MRSEPCKRVNNGDWPAAVAGSGSCRGACHAARLSVRSAAILAAHCKYRSVRHATGRSPALLSSSHPPVRSLRPPAALLPVNHAQGSTAAAATGLLPSGNGHSGAARPSAARRCGVLPATCRATRCTQGPCHPARQADIARWGCGWERGTFVDGCGCWDAVLATNVMPLLAFPCLRCCSLVARNALPLGAAHSSP